MNANIDIAQSKSLVIGSTGLVGSLIVELLRRSGERPIALSRLPREGQGIEWICGDLEKPDTLNFPTFETLYCTASAVLLANVLPGLFKPSLRRVIVFSSTSVITKQDTEVAAEREAIQKLADAEQRIGAACEQHGVAWTILRPTLIYGAGRDTNITPLSRLIRRFGFMPLVGGASGLRQPVHAEDLAIGAISAAASPATVNKIYALAGGETLPYREMIGRIFDGLKMPRRTISIPLFLWRASFVLVKPLFPGATVAMGTRMMQDMTFDYTSATQDFGWDPRKFKPVFE